MKSLRPARKLDYVRIGPFEITECINKVSYRVKLPKKYRIHDVFHISLLEPYRKDPSQKRTKAPPPPIMINQEEEYVVERIFNSRIYYKKIQYLVKWKGYTTEEATWEPITNLENAKDLVTAFHKENPKKPGGSSFKGGSM